MISTGGSITIYIRLAQDHEPSVNRGVMR